MMILAIILTAAGYFFSTGLFDCWILVWFAPLPIMLLALSKRKYWQVFLAAAISYFLGTLNNLLYLQTLIPPIATIKILFSGIGVSIVFALLILLMKCITQKNNVWWSMLIFPATWVLFELLTTQLSVNGTLGNMGYTQLKFLPLAQLASITGIWGISFVVTLFPAAFATAWYLRGNRKQLVAVLIISAFTIATVLTFGTWRLSTAKPVKHITIALLALPTSIHDLKTSNTAETKTILKKYIAEIPGLAKKRAKIIVIPEKMLTTTNSSNKIAIELLRHAASINRVQLVVGLRQLINGKKFNTALVISNTGKIIASYHKQHLLPWSEAGYLAGNKLAVVRHNSSKFGVAICKDMDFTNPALKYSKQGIGIMLVPALDFCIDGWFHSKPAIMRGIEGGYSVVRAAQWGLLLVSDKCGHILGKIATSPHHASILIVSVPIYSAKTAYGAVAN